MKRHRESKQDYDFWRGVCLLHQVKGGTHQESSLERLRVLTRGAGGLVSWLDCHEQREFQTHSRRARRELETVRWRKRAVNPPTTKEDEAGTLLW